MRIKGFVQYSVNKKRQHQNTHMQTHIELSPSESSPPAGGGSCDTAELATRTLAAVWAGGEPPSPEKNPGPVATAACGAGRCALAPPGVEPSLRVLPAGDDVYDRFMSVVGCCFLTSSLSQLPCDLPLEVLVAKAVRKGRRGLKLPLLVLKSSTFSSSTAYAGGTEESSLEEDACCGSSWTVRKKTPRWFLLSGRLCLV